VKLNYSYGGGLLLRRLGVLLGCIRRGLASLESLDGLDHFEEFCLFWAMVRVYVDGCSPMLCCNH